MSPSASPQRPWWTRPALQRTVARLVLICTLLWPVFPPVASVTAQGSTPDAAAPKADVTAQEMVPDTLPSAPAGGTIAVPGMQTPNGLAVHGTNRRIYVTSRDNGKLFMLDPNTFAVAGQAQVGSLPWGVAVDPALNRAWVANFGSGTVSVLDATGLGTVATLNLGPTSQPTQVGYLPAYQRVFVALHGSHAIAVINAVNNTVEQIIGVGDRGPWGLAINPNLNRVYVTFRETNTLVTLDPVNNWQPLPGHTIQPCSGGFPASPYGVAFSPDNKLYVACAPAGSVDQAVVYHVNAAGLHEMRRFALPRGGPNGGGIAVNPVSRNAFYTNSSSNNVSIIGYPSLQIVGNEPAGRDPFAVAADSAGGRVIVGNRADNTLTIINDPYLPMAYKVNGVAVNQANGKVFVTSRDNGLLLRLKGSGATDLEAAVTVGGQPWGVAVNGTTDRVYTASFAEGTVRALQASTLTPLTTIAVGGEPTFIEVNAATNRIFTVSHALNTLVVINGTTNAVEASWPTGGAGAFGLAVNPVLNRAYVSHRGSGDIATMDGANGWQPIESQRINACGSDQEPYTLAFNAANNRLYVACAAGGDVSSAVIYQASAAGLLRLTRVALGHGGPDGGGGIAVNPTTGNVFFTNSADGTVSIVNDRNELAAAPRPIGLDPFGIAVDGPNGYVYVGLRLGNDVAVFRDTAGPVATGPRLYLSRQDGCEGVPLTVFGAGFTASVGRTVELRMDANLLASATVDAAGAFMAGITIPGPKNPGGIRTLIAADPALPALTARASLRTPRTDLPVIFMGGIAGSRLVTQEGIEFTYAIPGWFNTWDHRVYGEKGVEEEIWLGKKSINEAMFWNDKHFYPLRLTSNGLDPYPDPWGRIVLVYPREPVWVLEPPASPIVDVYIGLYAQMEAALTAQGGRRLYHFGYDWRKNLDVTDPLLDLKINQVLAETGKDKVILVGHSMGGMLARNYVLNHGAARVDQIITFGTPYLGSVNPVKYLAVGDDMGMIKDIGPVRLQLDPEVVKEMAVNYGGLYHMLPSRQWFNRSPFDGALFDPRYLSVGSSIRGDLFGLWTVEDAVPLSYDQTKAYLARNYNAALVAQGDAFTAKGIGDLTQMTDQYINQRIIGTGLPTWGHMQICEAPCYICYQDWEVGEVCGSYPQLSAIPLLNALGDDTVPLRSAAASEPFSKMLQDGHYYFVDNSHHMLLGADQRVRDLVVGLLRGDFCTNQTALPPGNPAAGVAGVAGLTPDATEEDYAALGTTTGVQLTLVGDAAMTITDAQGRRLAPGGGLLAGYAGAIPGANLVEVAGAQVAALTTGGPFAVAISGTAAGGAARLKVENLAAGAVVRTLAFPGLPITTTTTANLTLAAASVEPDTVLAYRYTPDSPVETFTAAPLEGGQAGDATPPAVQVTLDRATGLVTITVSDGEGGSGVQQVLYSLGAANPARFLPYIEPFPWPAGAACVTGLALDRAGNTGASRQCLSYLPMITK